MNDSDHLAIAINRLGIIINAPTFRRFFELIKCSGGFSSFTLEMLSIYCDFENYTSFKNSLIESAMDLMLEDINTTKSGKKYWNISESICQKNSDSPIYLAKI